MTLSKQQIIDVISSNATDLCTLLNVEGEKHLLLLCMSPEHVQECIQGGDTNMERVTFLCEKMVKEIRMNGKSKMYDTLCEYLLKRSEAYKSMHHRFTAIGSTNYTDCNDSRSSDANHSELLLLQEKVKYLTEELMFWRQSHQSHVSKLITIENHLIEMKRASHHEEDVQRNGNNVPVAISTISGITSVPSPSLPARKISQFTFKSLPAMEANASGSYPPFHWQEEKWLQSWKEILTNEDSLDTLPLPPLVLNEDIANNVAIVIKVERYENEFAIHGIFHHEVPESVSPLNVRLELSLTFTKKDNTKWTVNKQIIVTIKHVDEDEVWPVLIRFYDVPFDSFSSLSAPTATHISINRISPDQKWFYWGLAPRFGRDWKFDTIHCNSLHGTSEFAREWKMTVMANDNTFGDMNLPPLVLRKGNVDNMVVCMFAAREENHLLKFSPRFHPSTPKTVQSREMLFKIILHVRKQDNAVITKHAQNTVTLGHDYDDEIIFVDFPWALLSHRDPPLVNVSILPANKKTGRKRHS